MFDALAATAITRLEVGDFKPESLAETAWSFAVAGVAAPSLFTAFARHGTLHASDFGARSLALTVWAYATAGEAAPALFGALAKTAARLARAGEMGRSEGAQIVWAYAHARYTPMWLLEALSGEAASHATAYSAEELSMVLSAYALMGYAPPRLLGRLTQQARSDRP